MHRLLILLLCLPALAGCGQEPARAPDTPVNEAPHTHNEPPTEHNSSTHEPETHAPAGHAGHGGTEEEFRWDHIKAPAPDHELIDLKNDKDPVTLKPVADITFEYKGYLVHVESDATRDKFENKPIKYLNMLSLEPRADGSVLLVDASSYQDAVTDFCPVMTESEVDPHGSVYLLHRGWKVFFCCWSSCGDEFLRDPAKFYDWYGLVERDGKLVRKEVSIK